MTEDLEYCDAIYRHFVERRAHSLMMTLRDWEQILTWRERDIPLGLVLGVIDRNVERSGGEGRPLRLTELGPLVRSAWIELRKSQVGQSEPADEMELVSFTMSFALSRIVEPAVQRALEAAPQDAVGAAVRAALAEALERLGKRGGASLTAEQLLSWEHRVNRRLLEAAEQAADAELLQQVREKCELPTSAAAGKPVELLRGKLYQISLRRALGVPRVRLFGPET